MIINWLTRGAVLAIVMALLLHFEVELPSFLSWIGYVPGDSLLIDARRGISFPLASAAIVSTLISLMLPSRR